MGFWHTGYMEFHEPVGLDASFALSPKVYKCKHCAASFLTAEALRNHLFESHTYNRPCLFINGIEVGATPMRVTQRIAPSSIAISGCNQAWLNDKPVTAKNIGQKISSIVNDNVKIRLANDTVSAEFRLQFDIASEDDLDGIDRCFLDVARRGRLDRREVENFINMARKYPTAMGYCDGICDYFYGVLIKEKSNESSLPYAQYREKFNRAANTLQGINRPVAQGICSVISFHFNHFWCCPSCSEVKRIDLASGRFERWISGDTSAAEQILSRSYSDTLERLLTDFEVEEILKWSVTPLKNLILQVENIEAMARRDLAEFDRTKLRILLAELYAHAGAFPEAKNHALELRNNQILGEWSEQIIARLS